MGDLFAGVGATAFERIVTLDANGTLPRSVFLQRVEPSSGCPPARGPGYGTTSKRISLKTVFRHHICTRHWRRFVPRAQAGIAIGKQRRLLAGVAAADWVMDDLAEIPGLLLRPPA